MTLWFVYRDGEAAWVTQTPSASYLQSRTWAYCRRLERQCHRVSHSGKKQPVVRSVAFDERFTLEMNVVIIRIISKCQQHWPLFFARTGLRRGGYGSMYYNTSNEKDVAPSQVGSPSLPSHRCLHPRSINRRPPLNVQAQRL